MKSRIAKSDSFLGFSPRGMSLHDALLFRGVIISQKDVTVFVSLYEFSALKAGDGGGAEFSYL